MTDLFSLSDQVLNESDSGIKPFNRINHELSELDDGLSFVEAFSNTVNFSTDDGLVIVDTSSVGGGSLAAEAIRQWRPDDRFNSLIYTHGHFDHVGALAEIRQATQADVLASEAEMELLGDLRQHVDGYLVPGELIEMGRQSLRVAATPGHTPAGVSLIHAEAAFVGDALFAGSVGGTRNRSDYKRQLAAVQSELLSLPEGTTLYPGHGPATTVAEELANNPFFTD